MSQPTSTTGMLPPLDIEPIETSSAGVRRERSVPCAICQTPTWNHGGRCDLHRKRCAICLVPIAFGNWCSARCFHDDEGYDHDDDRDDV